MYIIQQRSKDIINQQNQMRQQNQSLNDQLSRLKGNGAYLKMFFNQRLHVYSQLHRG